MREEDRPAIAGLRALLLATVALIVLAVVALILNANVFSDVADAYKFGRIDIPGSTIAHLPRERIELILENPLGNGVDVPRDLAVSAVPVGGGPQVSITRSIGGQFGSSGNRRDSGDDFRR